MAFNQAECQLLNSGDQPGASRRVINYRVNRIRRVFKWDVENQLVGRQVLHALQAVAALRAGRTEARETGPVRPVSEESVSVTLPFVTPQV